MEKSKKQPTQKTISDTRNSRGIDKETSPIGGEKKDLYASFKAGCQKERDSLGRLWKK